MKAHTISVKMSISYIAFIDKINTNMIRAGVLDKALSRVDICDKIEIYFKKNNKEYKDFIIMEEDKDGT